MCVCVCVSVFPFYANFLLKFPGSYDIEGKKGKTVGERGLTLMGIRFCYLCNCPEVIREKL